MLYKILQSEFSKSQMLNTSNLFCEKSFCVQYFDVMLWGATTGVRANSGQVETPGLKQNSWFHCKPIAKEDILKDNRVSRWQSHYYPTSEPYCKIEKANGYTAAVSSFVWPLDYFLKWAHQKAMLGENKGHNMMWRSQRNAVYCPRMIGT